MPHGDFKYVGYTGVFNVVDYSAVSFPSGVVVDKAKDKAVADSKAQSEYCQAARDSCEFKKIPIVSRHADRLQMMRTYCMDSP